LSAHRERYVVGLADVIDRHDSVMTLNGNQISAASELICHQDADNTRLLSVDVGNLPVSYG